MSQRTITGAGERRAVRQHDKAMSFVQCPTCNYDLATGEGERNCHYGDCPYLPEALDVRCPTCMFNFETMDGNPECNDPPVCDFARNVAPTRVANLHEWLAAR